LPPSKRLSAEYDMCVNAQTNAPWSGSMSSDLDMLYGGEMTSLFGCDRKIIAPPSNQLWNYSQGLAILRYRFLKSP